jgi:hypothetical protein
MKIKVEEHIFYCQCCDAKNHVKIDIRENEEIVKPKEKKKVRLYLYSWSFNGVWRDDINIRFTCDDDFLYFLENNKINADDYLRLDYTMIEVEED